MMADPTVNQLVERVNTLLEQQEILVDYVMRAYHAEKGIKSEYIIAEAVEYIEGRERL